MALHRYLRVLAGITCACIVVAAGYIVVKAQAPRTAASPAAVAPKYKFDPDWPKPLPNKWKMGGVTGLAVDKDDNIWVYNRPNDLREIELNAEVGLADCCTRPPSMIHMDKAGNVIGSFDPPQGHGMDVDHSGFIYVGNTVNGIGTVRKYDPKTGKLLMEVPHVPDRVPGGGGGDGAGSQPRQPGKGGPGPGGTYPASPPKPPDPAAVAAFRKKWPPTTPMIVGGIEEIRLDEPAHELYTADNYLGGRIMVFDLDTFKFKRGWGAYGHKLTEISTDDKDRMYTPGGPFPKEFRNHLTLNFSNDGLVYAADRGANRIVVTKKDGTFVKEFGLATSTAVPPPPDHPAVNTGKEGSAGGVGFSPDKDQRFLYISDLSNNTVWFLNRGDGKVVGRLGSMGENGGLFFGLHMIAVDSRGVLYTGEVFNGERVQRFLPVQ